MKKFFQGKMKILIMIAFLFLFFFNTVAYSGLASKLAITSEAMFRPITDIRVTGIKLVSASNGALESYSPKYNVDTTTTGFTLPSANSEITYKITVTNYGNVKQTIYKFIKNSVSAEGLNVKLTDFTSVCTDENCSSKNSDFTIVHPEGDSSSESNVKEFLITFTTTNPSSTTINIIEKYDFRSLYYISYNANGGKNAPQSQIKIYGDNLNLTKNEPTRDFYDFKGWSTSSTSTTIEYKAGEIYSPGTDEKVQDVTLYAVWQKKQAKLDLNYNIDGTWYYAGYNNKIQTGIKVNGEDKGYLNDFGGTYDYGTSYEIYGFKIDGVTIPYSKKYTVDGTNHLDISFNTINFKVNDANLGSITPTQIIVIPGTTFTISGNVITLSDGRIATASTKTITGYTIKFLNYTITPNSSTVNAKTMVTANFTKELEKYTISLNGNGATTAGTTAIYEKYNTGIYLDSALTKEMGTNANAITKPTRSYTVSFNANNTGITVPSAITKNYSYSGHYTDATNGTQMINENGYITSSFKNTLYTANGTLYAHWGTKPSVTIPEINKDGYKCTWNTSVDGNGTPYNGGAVTDKLNTQTLYAVCKVDTNTKYVVKHYKQKLDGTYPTEADDIDNLTGTTGASVSPAVKSYTGFTSPSVQTTTIKADGSTVVTYKYTRNKYTFTLGSSTGASTSGSTASGSYYYGSTITLKATASSGYTWSKWTSSNTNLVGNQTEANTTFTMPAGNITMTPSVTTNVLTFNDQSKPVTYNPTSSQTVNISPATNGTGSYSYSIISGNDNSYFSISGTTITVKSNTPANTSGYKITVRATDTNSKVTKDATITIIVDKKSVTKPTSPANKVYNAEEQNHGISVPEGTSIVTNGSTLKATNVGTYNVIFTLNSNYKWNDGTTSNITIQWKITAYNLSNATIGSISDQTYTGSEIKPAPSVTVPIPSGSKSTPTYTTTYSNNTNAGTATITLTGTGNYTGTKSKTFKIVPAENPVKVTANDLTYNTQAQSLVATKDVQGTICYSLDSVITSKCSTSTVVPTAINAGTYTVYYYINGNSNYKEKSGSVIVTIKKYDLSTNGIIGTINDQTYTGSEIKPTPLVTASMSNVGVATLVNNTDYTYSYSNNINAGTTSNPYATVNVTGKGNYTGTKSKTFKIIKATNPTVITANDLTYNAAEQTLVTSSKEQGYICYSLSAVPTSCSANSALAKGTNAGTYTVYYLISGNSNYNSKSGSVKVSIKQYDISKTATIGIINDQVYTGNAIKPTPNVTVPIPTGKTTTLVNNTDFTYSYSNNKNIGTANITITGQENYTGTKSTTFKISQKASLCTITSVPSLKYPSNATGSIQFKCTGDGKITVTSSSTGVIEVTNTGTTGAGLKGITAGKSKITVSQAAGNYEASSASADVTVTYSQYTVTLDGNGATTQGSTTAVATYNSTTLSTITNPIREYTITYDMGTTGLTKPDNGKVECRLNGWYTSSNNGTKVANNNTTPVLEASVSGYTNASKQWTKRSDATLYAGWEVIGTKLPIIEKEGNTCTWIDNNGSSFDSGQTGYTILTNKTLTARCLPNSYVLTVDPNGGKWNNTISASTVPRNYGTEYEVANPTRKGYTFTGWTKSGAGSWNSETNKYTFGAGAGTLTANWTPIKYNIKYELDGGVLSITNPTEYTVETETFTLNNPTKEGYIFKGWSTSLTSTSSYNATMKVEKGSTGDKEFRAVWQIITYNISYNLNGGTLTNVSNPTSYNITTETFTLKNPTRKGYTFKGWTGSNGNTEQSSVSIAKGSMGNKSYTANWTPIKYSIKYELDGGVLSTTNPTEYTVETETFTLNNPTKEGYTFKGWSTSLTSTSSYNATMTVEKGSTGDKEFRAVWQENTNTLYKVNHCTKDLNASTYTCESETKTGTTNSVIKVENLKKTIKGFKYSKGHVDGKDVTETTILANGKREISLYYEREIYTVKLSVNSGINKVSIVATGYETKIGNSSAAATGTYEYGTKITINAEVNTGYSFKAWTYNGASSLQDVNTSENAFTLTKNETYMATAQINQYTLTIDPSGGTWNDSTSASAVIRNYRETYSLSKPTRTGYTFAGWSLTTKYPDTCNDECKDKIEENVYTFGSISGSIKANWTENTYTVKFNANSGTGTMSDQSFDYTESKALTANTFTRTGYTFTGWSTSANGAVVYKDEQSVSKLTSTNNGVVNLYAKWDGNVYKIALNNTDTSFVSDSESVQRNKEVYLKYGDGVYLNYTNGTLSNKMTTSTNNIYKPIISLGVDIYESYDSSSNENKPSGTMYVNYPFKGYYSSDGKQLIDENGNITSSFTNTLFSSDSIITMQSGDQKVSIPTAKKDGYTFEAWFTKPGVGSMVSPSVKIDDSYKFIDGTTVTSSIYAHWLKNVEIEAEPSENEWTYNPVNVSPVEMSDSDSGAVSYQYCFLSTDSSCTESDWKEVTDASAVTVIGGDVDDEGNFTESEIEGYIRYRAVSSYGKTPESSSKHIKIDRVVPSTTLTAYKTGTTETVESNTWTNSFLEFKFGAITSGPSGATIKYCIQDVSVQDIESTDEIDVCEPTTIISANTAIPVDLTNTKEGTYMVAYKVISGSKIDSETYLESEKFSYNALIDRDAPVITVTATKLDDDTTSTISNSSTTQTTDSGNNFTKNFSKNYTTWVKNGYSFDLDVTDKSDVVIKVGYNNTDLLSTASNYGTIPSYDEQEDITESKSFTLDENGYRYGVITVTDEAGNYSKFTFKAQIDDVEPVIKIQGYNQNGDEIKSGSLSKKGMTYKVTIVKSGVSNVTVYTCNTAASKYDPDNVCDPSTKLGVGRTNKEINSTAYKDATSMDRYVTVQGISETGLESDKKTHYSRIGTTDVEINVYKTTDTSYSNKISTKTWVNKKIQFRLIPTSTTSTLKYCIGTGDSTVSTTTKCTPSKAVAAKAFVKPSNTGKFHIGYQATTGGKAGSIHYYNAYIDITAPTIKITAYKLNSAGNGPTGNAIGTKTNADYTGTIWRNFGYYFSLSGSGDNSGGSGIKSMKWQYNTPGKYTDTAATKKIVKSTPYNKVSNVLFNSSGLRYGKITLYDNAGNSTTVAITVLIDKVAPNLSLNLYKYANGAKSGKSLKKVTETNYSTNTWVNYRYYFDVTGTTGGSGIKSITLQANAGGAIASNRDLIDPVYNITTSLGHGVGSSGNRYIRVIATDKAGNTTTKNVRIFIDLGKPTLEWGSHSTNGSELTINYKCSDTMSRWKNSSGTVVSSVTKSVKLTSSGSKQGVCIDRAGNKVTSNSPTWYYNSDSKCGVSYYQENCWYEQEYLGMDSDYSCITSGHVCKGSSGTKCYCYTKEYTKKVCGDSTPVYNTCWHQ